MNKEVYYQMSQKQLGRYLTISKLLEKQLTVKQAAISLGLSTRQIIRLKLYIDRKGKKFYTLISTNKGYKRKSISIFISQRAVRGVNTVIM